MILTAHQPAYLPWPGLLHKIASADLCVILDNVPFERGSFVNRNRIPTKNGPVWLTIPVLTEGHLNRPLSSIQIADQRWRRKHWETLRQTYQSSPRWHLYQEELRDYYATEWPDLASAATDTVRQALAWYNIQTPLVLASAYRATQRKNNLIVELCEKTGADTFLFGAQGRDYADRALYSSRGISIAFQSYSPVGAVAALESAMHGVSREKILEKGSWKP